MSRLLPLFALCGCPYVFGPADLSNVDSVVVGDSTGAPADTGDTAQTVLDPTADTGMPDPDEIEVTYAANQAGLALTLVAADPDELLWGGTATVVGSEGTVEYAIPGDLDWDPIAVSRLDYPLSAPCDSLQEDLGIELRDQDGVLRAATTVAVAVDGRGILDHTTPAALGEIGHGTVFCGVIGAPGESDRTEFTIPLEGRWRLSTTWNNASDIDLRLRDAQGEVLAVSAGTNQPETLSRELLPDDYALDVFHFGGPLAERWHVFVELLP